MDAWVQKDASYERECVVYWYSINNTLSLIQKDASYACNNTSKSHNPEMLKY
jgi:hypothetical protein